MSSSGPSPACLSALARSLQHCPYPLYALPGVKPYDSTMWVDFIPSGNSVRVETHRQTKMAVEV